MNIILAKDNTFKQVSILKFGKAKPQKVIKV